MNFILNVGVVIMKLRRNKITILILGVLILIASGFWYVNDYYHSEVKIADYQKRSREVCITEIERGLYLDGPGKDIAMIFYPGAKVEYTAYLPLFNRLTEWGVDCFLLKMPYNLAIFGQNRAENIMEQYDYDRWYLSGHSLGAAMAASYAAGHLKELDGLVLLAGYPTKSLQSDDFSVLSLYGSEDGILNLKKLEEGRAYMPKQYTEICINGGNHAWFGNYGEQNGDYPATIRCEEQQEQTVTAILEMIILNSDSP